MPLNTLPELIEDLRAGRMVILMDDEDRENEGDLVIAANRVRAEDINFMARYGRGLICLTLTKERCERLRLPLMVSGTDAKQATNFTVSIEAAQGVTTGISAADRAVTVRAAAATNAKPEDLTQPGHIFPLMAQPGGVLTRAGHTEAGCDLAQLAGLEPAAVIVEILNEDGTMARRPELETFAARHNIKIGTIADLIHYRLANENTLLRAAHCPVSTRYGRFDLHAYKDCTTGQLHFALTLGEIRPEVPTLVRVHMQSTLCDVLGTVGPECGWPLHAAAAHIAAEGHGAMIILRREEDADALVNTLRRRGAIPEHGELPPEPVFDLRGYGTGAQILRDLGVRRMRLMSAPKKLHALSGFGLEVTEYIQD